MDLTLTKKVGLAHSPFPHFSADKKKTYAPFKLPFIKCSLSYFHYKREVHAFHFSYMQKSKSH